MKRWRLAGVVVVTVFALATAGCSSKKKGSELEGQGGAGANGGISDQALGGGSLALAQQGRLGAGDTGPLHDIHFDYDSFDLDETSRQTLQENAAWLKDHSTVRVEVEATATTAARSSTTRAGREACGGGEELSGGLGRRTRSHDDHQLWRRAADLPGGDRSVLEPQSPRAFRARGWLSGQRRWRRAAWALATLAVVGGCATHADLERVKRDQQEMRARLADVQVSLDAINRRLDTVRTELTDKGGGRDPAAMRELQKRVADLEAHTATVAPPPAEGSPGLPPVEAPTPNIPRTEAANLALAREDRQPPNPANEAYRRALQSYRSGQADQAIQQFREYLRNNSKSDLADNAQFWIGEAYYSKGDYNRSIIELNEVLLKYPQGDQVPGALLALATAFQKSGDPIDAKLILQKLISDHPKSEEANVGRQQLQTLAD